MATFLTSPDICQTETVNFFTSGNYARPSFSSLWSTRDTPDTEGLNTPVYLLVLDKFNIPVDSSNGLPPGGTLPGIDIKSMDAIQAIRLSMAEALTSGEWWEILEDNQGGVKFIKVFDEGSPGKTVNLDVRLCVPSTNKTNEVDMVIVNGYKAPPQVFAKDFSLFEDVVPAGSGPINPQSITGDEDVFTVDMSELIGGCHQTQLNKEATKSYKDPLIQESSQFASQVENPFYDIKAYESIVTWVVKIDGMPESPEDAARVSYSWNENTTWFFRPGFPTFTKTTEPTEEDFGCETGLTSGQDITYYRGSFNYQGVDFTDRYGFNWPLAIKPASILYTGRKVKNIIIFGTGDDSTTFVYVNPVKELLRLGEGSQWTYVIEGINRYRINVYYQPNQDPLVWDVILDALQVGGELSSDVVVKVAGKPTVGFPFDTSSNLLNAGPAQGIIPGPNNLGFYVDDFFLGVLLDRPSVTVTTVEGDARTYSDALRVQYAPIIKFDPPSPIAYKHKDKGLVLLGNEEQAEGLQDTDPTTCQNFEDTPLREMQDLKSGNTVEVSLPFCESPEVCGKVAETIFDYQNYIDAQTFTLTCGPDDGPEIGAAVEGYDNNLRIESISYSYSDGSAYTIEVTLGPVFANIGSWNNGAWIRKRENVQREAIVTFTAGDGINYRVMVQGLGEFNAINGARDIWRVGEVVTVTVYNVPVEE